jgi:uncharacterized repeat protein (TIGR01451 family)
MKAARGSPLWTCTTALLFAVSVSQAGPVSDTTRERLGRGLPTWVVVEYDGTTVDRAARDERLRRGLAVEDDSILAQRRRDYRGIKAPVESALRAADVTGVIDYGVLPLSAWRLTSSAALARLQAGPGIRIHENAALRPVSVSDLGFIGQPAAAATGATGAGATVAVIDGGLGSAYLNYADFGPCTGVATPASTCRVVINKIYYPGGSTQTTHGTNVAAIALGVAPGAKLANYDVFNGNSASVADILGAMNDVITNRSAYNIVAINLSLGDGSSHPTRCGSLDSPFVSAISTALSNGIHTVVAAGNSGSKTGLADPACVSGAVSVGAVYDADYGSRGWVASAASGGTCTDTTAADLVTCFSQSASYLSLLAPGSFVSAPDASFQLSGTSQAAPHVTGAIAALRARYPAETTATTLQRLQSAGVSIADPANGLGIPRLDLSASARLGAALSITGSGPATAVSGNTSGYTLTVRNAGPLIATHVVVSFPLPAGASLASGSSAACALSGSTVLCTRATLNVGSSVNFTVRITWHFTGGVYIATTVAADQIDSAPIGQQSVAFGTAPAAAQTDGDAPLPTWTWALLGGFLMLLLARRGTQVAIEK